MAKARTQYGAWLIRPLGLAGSQRELGVAVTCSLVLALVLVIEILTPNDVVGSVAVLPVIAAMWTLSPRLAAAVGLVAVLFFWLVVASEETNRTTVLLLGGVGFVVAVMVRTYATRLNALLSSSGQRASAAIRPALPVPQPVESLTRRELEVAALASHGLTAAEIGSQLHISERTVESHLANAYAKLAIHSRSALRQMID
ncbi:MAG TPA: helix-turn-helix transcriptional regulator [Candidatus Dormibacteraeota bacterium]|nr:helix-turn-helix transcriptional regulator [Candidatus Dormibacteraeota bacterium]